MKAETILLLGLITLGATHLIAGEPKGQILNYGIFKRSASEEIIKTPETPSGVTRIPTGHLTFSMTTNRIPARKGVLFGIRYEVTNLDLKDGEMFAITKVTTHPPMKKPDGKITESFSYVERLPVQNGRVEGQTGYSFDHDYELVTGVWRIEMQVKGKTLMTQEFTVLQEQ
jgi:hypothetical protein